jgi:hypothetical protein|tara:strand:+ start:313 stop:492 length:180 start_codon:yes stop_codon:yes gene_type:complete
MDFTDNHKKKLLKFVLFSAFVFIITRYVPESAMKPSDTLKIPFLSTILFVILDLKIPIA